MIYKLGDGSAQILSQSCPFLDILAMCWAYPGYVLGGDGGDDDGGRISSHPQAPIPSRRDNTSRSGNPSLRYRAQPIADRSEGVEYGLLRLGEKASGMRRINLDCSGGRKIIIHLKTHAQYILRYFLSE